MPNFCRPEASRYVSLQNTKKSFFGGNFVTPSLESLQPIYSHIDLSKCKDFHPGLENPQYALEGLENFSHVWILFHFHENSEDGRNFVKTKVAPPRLKGSKVGLFSTRSPHRPNPIGLTLAKLTRIEGCKVFLQGMDLLDQVCISHLDLFLRS